jgi:hypothetical protein
MSETETPEVLEPTKPSKLARIKSAAITTGIIAIPGALMVVPTVLGYKTSLNQLEAAKLTLEAAKLNTQA